MSVHKSSVYVPSLEDRRGGRNWKYDDISSQFRMVIRLAVACAEHGADYEMTWDTVPAGKSAKMRASITCRGAIPMPKKLKEPKVKVIREWQPKQWEAEYRLNAYHSKPAGCEGRLIPAMVIEHSSGISLMMSCETGEWGTEHGDANPNGKWHVTHTASGLGFGLELPIQKAADAVCFAAAQPVDWTLHVDSLKELPAFRRAGLQTRAKFGNISTREDSMERLEALERAAA